MLHFALTLLLALQSPDPGPYLTKADEVILRREVPEVSLRPPRPIDVLHYDLVLEVNAETARIAGTVRMDLVPLRPLDRVTLDFTTASTAPQAGMLADSVAVDGLESSFVHDADSLAIDPGRTVTPNDTLEVFVRFRGAPLRPEGVGFGFARRLFRDTSGQADPDSPVLCTLSEPSGARTWWPCHDHPFDNATATVTTIGPPQFRLAAPGTKFLDETVDGLRRQGFAMTTPIPSYLVSVILADQVSWTTSMEVDHLLPDGSVERRTMPLEYYAPPALVPDAQYSWKNTEPMLTKFAELFGPYPYADIKYGMALFVFGGAMEHPTLSSMGDYTVSSFDNELYPGPAFESIVAHELVHQWFGDAVHVGRWGDIWLNEGFARFGEVLWLEEYYGPEYGRIWLDRLWRPSYGGPLRDPDVLFSGTVYNKGAWILHQLRQVMGHDALITAMRDYVTDPDLRFGPVFVEDFQAACETVYGAPLDWFFDAWLNRPGRPALRVRWNPTADGVALDVSQPADRVYRLPLPVQLILDNGELQDEIVWIGESGPDDALTLRAPVKVVDVRVDPYRNWLLDLDLPPRPAVDLITVRPNPFNPQTTLRFVVREATRVKAEVFDLRGRRVKVLFDEDFGVAVHDRDWDGRDADGRGVASGVYVVRMEAAGAVQKRKVTLIR